MFGSRRVAPVIDFGHEFALVDVETTGLSAQSDRIVQVAVRQVDRYGKTQNVWHSLVDPGRDPGPTHIHAITSEMLTGAPRFTAVAPMVAELIAGRVLVAHNAVFDWGFLQAESLRCVVGLESSHRLCTLALARRLDLDVRDFKLGTLAGWARIRQRQAHSAVDDVRVLEAIFLKLMTEATRGQVPLPMSANTPAVRQPYGERAP
jgi:DNA polymerase-3 subunit epsilon